MTQRDQKTLLILVLSVVGAFIAFMVLQSWFLGPLGEYNQKIDNFTGEVQKKELEYRILMRDLQLLKDARAQSLSPNQVKAQNDYLLYLQILCSTSGLTDPMVAPQPIVESKAGQLVGGLAAKKPGHVVIKFGVHAKGSLSAIVKAMENLERTPVLHRVSTLSISRQEGINANKKNTKDLLTLDFGIEALIAAGTPADFTPTLQPDTTVKLPSSASPRRYVNEIASKNIFVGYQPPQPDPEPDDDPIIEMIPQKVRLTYTEPDVQKATLRNFFEVREMKLQSNPRSGFSKFQIRNEERTKVLIDATVLRIDQRDVYFQVKEDIYGIHIGQTIAQAMKRSLSQKELDDLDLTRLIKDYDPKTDPTRTDAKKTKGRAGGNFPAKGGFGADGESGLGTGLQGKNKGGFGGNGQGGKGKGGFGGPGGFRGKGKKGGADDGARLGPDFRWGSSVATSFQLVGRDTLPSGPVEFAIVQRLDGRS